MTLNQQQKFYMGGGLFTFSISEGEFIRDMGLGVLIKI